jgi:hypothetical protein
MRRYSNCAKGKVWKSFHSPATHPTVLLVLQPGALSAALNPHFGRSFRDGFITVIVGTGRS